MSEQDPNEVEEKPAEPDDAEEIAELASEISHDGKGNKMVSLSTMLKYKREAKELGKKVKELEPVAQRVTDVEDRLAKADPVLNAAFKNPKIMAEIIKAAKGTHQSADTTAQPDNDPDAQAEAEDRGWYLQDGYTPDVARGRRALERMARVAKTQAEDVVRPYANVTLGGRADQNIRAAIQMTDNDGVPMASETSIMELAKSMPNHLLSDERVVDLIINAAIGLDRRNGRTPKAPPDDPLYLEAGSGRRRSGEVAIDAGMRATLQRLGLTEKEFAESSKKLEEGVATRRGAQLGGR